MAEVYVLSRCNPRNPWKHNESSIKPYNHFNEKYNCCRNTVLGLAEYFTKHYENVANAM